MNCSCAYALVNGMQLLQCALPTASEGICTVEDLAQQNLTVMEDFGHFEVSCLFYAGSGQIVDPAYIGELIVDDSVIYLGQLPGGEGPKSVVVTRYVTKYPKVLKLRLRYEQRTLYDHPDEELLLQEMVQLLSDPILFPSGGSAPHTNVHNRLKDLEHYHRVVTQHYHGKWTSFLNNHQDKIRIHKEQHSELHLVLTDNLDCFRKVDQEAEVHRAEQENAVVESLYSVLRERDYEYRELLQRMGQIPAFTSQLTPSMTMLNRFLQSNRDVFWIRKDPEHTTRVGLIRH